MSNAILIIGEPGTGKSTSIRNLDPKTTFIINVINKPLPFKSFFSDYKPITKETMTGNYFASDDHEKISKMIDFVEAKLPEIKTLVIDDFQYVMSNEFMRRSSEKGWEKFTEIAEHAWKIIKKCSEQRQDLDCFILSHSETPENLPSKCKTIGKMLDDKICLEGMFSIVFHSVMNDGVYKFLTQHDGQRIAKSPMGMFQEKWIDNDLFLIKQKIHDYYSFSSEEKF